MAIRMMSILAVTLLFHTLSTAQESIAILNPSFELYYAQTQHKLEYWESCMIRGYTPPDVHSKTKKYWSNTTAPYAGDSYVGMVVRPDTTFEQLAQKLDQSLQRDAYYAFEIHLALPQHYLSPLRTTANTDEQQNLTPELVDFANPVQLQVWGFYDLCDPGQKLAETTAVKHRDWKKYVIQFQSDDDYAYIAFIPYFTSDSTYAGSILIDECSPIFQTDASYQYSYVKQNVDSLFLEYASVFNPDKEEYIVSQDFVKYFTTENPTNYWVYDFSNPSFYSKRLVEKSSYAPKVTEYRYSYDNVLTDQVIFYKDAVHTSYYANAAVSSVKRYRNGDFYGKQKIYYPSGNDMIEFEATVDKTYIGKGQDHKNIFQFRQRIKNLNVASRDGQKMSKFKIPKDTDLGDISITADHELLFYRTNGRIIDKMKIGKTYIDSNTLLSIIRR